MSQPKLSALITGYDGFVGPYLARHLLENQRKVYGTVYSKIKEISVPDFIPPQVHKKVKVIPVDLNDFESVSQAVRTARPHEVYHLAGISHVPTSWVNPRDTFSTNVMGAINLLEALRETGREVKVLIVSSAEVYGIPDAKELPTKEGAPLRPENPYAASKAALDLIARQWSRYPRFHVVRMRPFSHTGPGQRPDFVCSAFARQVAAVSSGQAPPVMKVGDLTARRDFTDVRDVVRAYLLALENAPNGSVFNVCSGKSQLIKDVLNTLKTFHPGKIEVQTDPARLRPSEIPETLGSHELLTEVTNWQPEIPFPQTLRDLYEYWLEPQKGHQTP